MPEKTYKARVEIGMIVEMEVEAVHEDNAAAIAETLANHLAAYLTCCAENDMDFLVDVANCAVRCTEVEEK